MRPPAALRAALDNAPFYCLDCHGASVRVTWSQARSRWQVNIWHAPTCPVPRSARMRRALDMVLLDLIAARYHLADYDLDGDLIAQHRVSGYPAR